MTFNKVYNTQDVINLINQEFCSLNVANLSQNLDMESATTLYVNVINKLNNAEKGSED